MSIAPGQVMRFVLTRGKPGVWALGCGELDGRTVDVGRYVELLARTIDTITSPFDQVKNVLYSLCFSSFM